MASARRLAARGRACFRSCQPRCPGAGRPNRDAILMTTYLIGRNEMMGKLLARRLESLSLPMPTCWHSPDWLLRQPPANFDAPPAAVAVVDCSGTAGDARALLDLVRTKLAPQRWLVLSDTLDAGLMRHAASLGASGCLPAPAPVDLVCAAASLIWAGGQCFPRAALSLPDAMPSAL